MARLTTLLKADGVEVRERTFKSAIGIEDLNDPFVSFDIFVLIIIIMTIARDDYSNIIHIG